MDRALHNIKTGQFVPHSWMERHRLELLSAIVVSPHGHTQLQDWCVAFNTTAREALADITVPLDVSDNMVVQAVRMGAHVVDLFDMIDRRPAAFDTCVREDSIDSAAFATTVGRDGYSVVHHLARRNMLATLEELKPFDWYSLSPDDRTLIDCALLGEGGRPSTVVPFFMSHGMSMNVVVPSLGITLLEQSVRTWPGEALAYLARTQYVDHMPVDVFAHMVARKNIPEAVLAWVGRFNILHDMYKDTLLMHHIAIHWQPAYGPVFDAIDIDVLNTATGPKRFYLIHCVGQGMVPVAAFKRYVPMQYWNSVDAHGNTAVATLLNIPLTDYNKNMYRIQRLTNMVDAIEHIAYHDFAMLEEQVSGTYLVTMLTTILAFMAFRVNTQAVQMPPVAHDVENDQLVLSAHFETTDTPAGLEMVKRFHAEYTDLKDYALTVRHHHRKWYGVFLHDVQALQDALVRCLNTLGAMGIAMDADYMQFVNPVLAKTFDDTLAKQVMRQHRAHITRFTRHNPQYTDRLRLRRVLRLLPSGLPEDVPSV
ncbi:hypothetical protein ORF077L [Spotted knifejaw iridovirus]|uniref:ORF067 n=5 Tax=Infectious spleen and kidney necrosis virus TaxID=180170 RepID=A0A218PFE6_RSIV|nr:hypothetical protein [Rock bream iridovirus]AMM72702.1 ORF075L [giant sea perch iridovirus - K1]QIQ54632.1 ORF067 [Red seabream iridovirus]WBR81553.1 hypothetical protein ORF077L [Spotted knifejaw iridovirus]QND75869.1 hypothetical protein ORF084 [Red seabream iridovirus]